MLKILFDQIWNSLRAKQRQMPYYLQNIRIKGLRGIQDLSLNLSFPVSVLAGPNGCGKSTVLYAAACAYSRQPNVKRRCAPDAFFPVFHDSKQGSAFRDAAGNASLEYVVREDNYPGQYAWKRNSGGKWALNPAKANPQRICYLRTLADLTNPSEVRGALQIARQSFQSQKIGPALISFAQRILPNRYQFLYQLSAHRRDLLFAKLETGAFYSEFHMAAGERVVLRLSREISELHDALILIDEVDVGLHPFTQQHLMLELQRIALRNSLQIIVTTHSPVIIESVPPEGRIFLEREDDNVKERTPYRDVLQRALYGRPLDRLSILCEDSVAKYLILGVMDWLSPRLNLSSSDVDIGHDTGKDEFPHHVRLLARLQQMSDFLFVIDGDGRTMESKLMGIAKRAGQPIDLLFLPGDGAPEEWIWERLHQHSREYADRLHIDCAILERQLNLVGRSYESAVGKKSDVAKYRLGSLLEGLGHTVENVCRVVGYAEADSGFLVEFRERLHDAIIAWRGRQD